MDLKLTDKLAIITGGSKGIGAATARILAGEGCDVVIVARSSDELGRVAKDISAASGRNVSALPGDVSDPTTVERIAAEWSHADILVNNAGSTPGGRLDEVSEQAWRSAWDLKVFGYINLARALWPAMRARHAGTIVNVIGSAAQLLDPSYIAGAVGNAALTAFTKSLGSDSHLHGIRVVGVSPGPVATERLLQLEASGVLSSVSRAFGRVATPEEIAWAIAFLASPVSAYTSGDVLTIDGGVSASALS